MLLDATGKAGINLLMHMFGQRSVDSAAGQSKKPKRALVKRLCKDVNHVIQGGKRIRVLVGTEKLRVWIENYGSLDGK